MYFKEVLSLLHLQQKVFFYTNIVQSLPPQKANPSLITVLMTTVQTDGTVVWSNHVCPMTKFQSKKQKQTRAILIFVWGGEMYFEPNFHVICTALNISYIECLSLDYSAIKCNPETFLKVGESTHVYLIIMWL